MLLIFQVFYLWDAYDVRCLCLYFQSWPICNEMESNYSFQNNAFLFRSFRSRFSDLMFLLIIIIDIIISRAVQHLALSGNIQRISLEFHFFLFGLCYYQKRIRKWDIVCLLLACWFFFFSILSFDNISNRETISDHSFRLPSDIMAI